MWKVYVALGSGSERTGVSVSNESYAADWHQVHPFGGRREKPTQNLFCVVGNLLLTPTRRDSCEAGQPQKQKGCSWDHSCCERRFTNWFFITHTSPGLSLSLWDAQSWQLLLSVRARHCSRLPQPCQASYELPPAATRKLMENAWEKRMAFVSRETINFPV